MSDYGYRKIGAASIPVAVGNPAENARHALAAIERARAKGAQALVLPELCLSGGTCGDLFRQSALLNACEAALLWLLEKNRDSAMLVVVSLPVRALGRLYNCAAVMQSGNLLGLVPKEYFSGEEARWFAAYQGEQAIITIFGREAPFGRALFQSGEVSFAIEIGSDLFGPSPPSIQMALRGAEIILNPCAIAEQAGGHAYRRDFIVQQSARLHAGYVLANAGPGESTTDAVHSGACVIAENGHALAVGPRFAQEGAAIYACVDVELLRAERRFDPAWNSLQPEKMPVITCDPLPKLNEAKIDRVFAPRPFVPENPALRHERCQEVLDIQMAGLIKRMRHTGMKGMILGVSGGLDSTLALLVALRACKSLGLDAKRVLGVTLPGYGTSFHTRQTVDELVRALGFTLREIDIRPACGLHMRDIGHDPQIHDATYENIQARERTQILMDLANKENALLLGTGTLSELALGWCTYNGDHMSMYNPNSGVPKTLVKHLIAFVAREEHGDSARMALRRVLNTPISPELLPADESGQISQKTEEQIGSYDVHDFYLYHFFRFGFAPAKLYFMAARAFHGEYAPAQLKDWLVLFLRRFFAHQFKRSCLPDGPRVGSVSLSPRGNWRMPSDAAANLWNAMAEDIKL